MSSSTPSFIRSLSGIFGVLLIFLGMGSIFFPNGCSVRSPGSGRGASLGHNDVVIRGKNESPLTGMLLLTVGGSLVAYGWFRDKL